MNENTRIWKLYSGANWTLNDLWWVVKFGAAFTGCGFILGWLATVA